MSDKKKPTVKRVEVRIIPGGEYGSVHRAGVVLDAADSWVEVTASEAEALVAATDQHGRALVEQRKPRS